MYKINDSSNENDVAKPNKDLSTKTWSDSDGGSFFVDCNQYLQIQSEPLLPETVVVKADLLGKDSKEDDTEV